MNTKGESIVTRLLGVNRGAVGGGGGAGGGGGSGK